MWTYLLLKLKLTKVIWKCQELPILAVPGFADIGHFWELTTFAETANSQCWQSCQNWLASFGKILWGCFTVSTFGHFISGAQRRLAPEFVNVCPTAH